jgi:putative spermidine/putrescine transport system substrate-binding protein
MFTKWRYPAITLGLVAVVSATTLTTAATAKKQSALWRPPGKMEGSLVFAAPGGSVQTGMQTCAINGFQNRTGVKVTYLAGQPQANLAIIAAQMSNQTVDVFWGSDPQQYIGIHHNFFAKYPYSAIPNSKFIPADLQKKLRDGGYDKSGFVFSTTMGGIEYNAKVFQQNGWSPPSSLKDLWDPKYKGHVAMYDLLNSFPLAYFVQVAKAYGGNESNIEPGLQQFIALKPSLVGSFYTTGGQMDTAFQQGSAWIAMNSGSRTYLLQQQGVPAGFAQPKEGVAVLDEYLDVVRNAPHPNAALAFINYLLSPGVQACLADATGFAPIQASAYDKMTPALKHYMVPDKGIPIAKISWAQVQHSYTAWDAQWNAKVIG